MNTRQQKRFDTLYKRNDAFCGGSDYSIQVCNKSARLTAAGKLLRGAGHAGLMHRDG